MYVLISMCCTIRITAYLHRTYNSFKYAYAQIYVMQNLYMF